MSGKAWKEGRTIDNSTAPGDSHAGWSVKSAPASSWEDLEECCLTCDCRRTGYGARQRDINIVVFIVKLCVCCFMCVCLSRMLMSLTVPMAACHKTPVSPAQPIGATI